jgi:hypothetical protein
MAVPQRQEGGVKATLHTKLTLLKELGEKNGIAYAEEFVLFGGGYAGVG